MFLDEILETLLKNTFDLNSKLGEEGVLAIICCRVLGNQGRISVKNRTLA